MPRIYRRGFFLLLLLTVSKAIQPQNNEVIPVTPADEAELMNLGSNINSTFTEYTPFITPDEKILFFESDRPGSIGDTGNFDLWYSLNANPDRAIPSFSLPINPGIPVNSNGFDGLPSLRILRDGTYEMYFTSYASETRKGPQQSNIYYTRQVGAGWSEPVSVDGINSDFHDRMPSVSPDGRFLFFSSDRPGGFGKDDIWVSVIDQANNRWGRPVNLGSIINSPASEISPSMHVDGITLYISSDRAGGVGSYDIYVTQRINSDQWKMPRNLGIPYNTEQDDEYPTVVKSGAYMYFTSNRPGGQGGFDIYRGRVPGFAKPVVIVSFQGRIIEENTTKGIEATISVRGDERRFDMSSGLPGGNFKADFLNDKIYELLISAPGYEPYRYTLDLRKTHDPVVIKQDFALKRISEYFDSYNLILQFFDTEGQNVAGRAAYRFDPRDKTIMKVENNIITLGKPQDEVRWNSFLEKNHLIIMAEAEGYENLDMDLSMRSIMENRKNTDEKNIYIPIEMKRLGTSESLTPSNGNLILIESIYFETNISEKINVNENGKINKILNELKKPGSIIELHGHTDRRGGVERNNPLSLDRARFIKSILMSSGIEDEKIRVFGHNFSRPAVKELDEKTRGKNRRVEIFIRKQSQ